MEQYLCSKTVCLVYVLLAYTEHVTAQHQVLASLRLTRDCLEHVTFAMFWH